MKPASGALDWLGSENLKRDHVPEGHDLLAGFAGAGGTGSGGAGPGLGGFNLKHSAETEVPKRRNMVKHHRHSEGGPRGHHNRTAWTEQEVGFLVRGVRRLGEGKWSKILHEGGFAESRTSVDLKDKWRNLKKYKYI